MTTRPTHLLFCTLLLAGCDPEPVPGNLRDFDCGTDSGDPLLVPQVCGEPDGDYHYIDVDECDAGMVHYCNVGEYWAGASIKVCCGGGWCQAVKIDEPCWAGHEPVCDIL
jgi:hypothetical protein